MILDNAISTPVTKSGITETKKMSIAANGKMFKIMSDTLYQDKIGSIVRETCTNAADGHRKAGRMDIPFHVHVPTIFEPYFSVTDTGTGMSHDTVMNVFSTYFMSTKDNSNTEVGGFGLGAKTPFSYTDSFIVVSQYDGIRTTYSAMMNEQGEPEISVMGVDEYDATLVNGIEVRIDVEQGNEHRDDINKFVEAIRTQLRFMDVKPILSTNAVQIHEVEYKSFIDSVDYAKIPENLSGQWIVQGGVGYPLNVDLIKNALTPSHMKFLEINRNLVMFFDIGQIEVIPSREAISYSPATVKNIQAMIDKMVPILTASVVAQANAFTDHREYFTWLNDHTVRRMLSLASYDTKSAPCLDGLELYWRDAYSASYVFKLTLKEPVLTPVAVAGEYLSYMTIGYSGRKTYHNIQLSDPILHFAIISNNDTIYVRDKCVAAIGRLKVVQELSGRVNVLEHPRGAEFMTDALIASFEAQAPGIKFKRVSELPAPAKAETVKRGTPVVYKMGANDRFDSISKWERVYDEEELEGGLYFEFDEYPFIKNPLLAEHISLLNLLVRSKMIDKPILAIKSSKVESLTKDNPTFAPVLDHIKALAAQVHANLFKSTVRLNR